MNETRDTGAHAGADHDHATDPAATIGGAAGASDETFAWTNPDEPTSGGDPRATAERMIGQLQSMIDSVATQAAPVVRQIGAKAAELAAVAADRAGPLAHKAADVTAGASGRIAEKSRTWAADLRNRVDGQDDADADSRSAVAVDGADDAVERAAQDDPAEGGRG
ncbi:MAG TPA: hypothetical protein VM427_04815 [Patescibacteria group bacterium]|nr:hypothetical protein [Patescibacteria group bacterium]